MSNDNGNSIKLLEENIGKTVTIEFMWYGNPKEETGTLKVVRPYHEVGLEQSTERTPHTTSISFIESRRAVKKITSDDGVLLYENSLVTPEHDNLSDDKVYELMVSTFGEQAAEPYKPKPRATAAK